MSSTDVYLSGDQIATYTSLTADGNGTERVVTIMGVETLGTAADVYRVHVEQIADGVTQFTNGQFITIYDSEGNVVLQTTTIHPDAEQGIAAGDEHLLLEGANMVIDLAGLSDQTTVTYTYADEVAGPNVGDNDGELDFADARADFPCFVDGTLIRTPGGDVPVEALGDGDLVLTLDRGPQPIFWIRSRRLRLTDPFDPQKPVTIAPGALGSGVPVGRLDLSPQHRILWRDEAGEALVPAKALTHLPGIRVRHGCRQVRYHSILLARHAILIAQGAACESFYPGRWILSVLPSRLRDELFRLMPLLMFGPEAGYGPPAREILGPRRARARCRRLAAA